MYIFQATLLPLLANATTIGACVVSIGFMLRFLLAMTREQNRSLAGFRLEYRVNSALLDAETMPVQAGFPLRASARSNRRKKEYDRVGLFPGAPQALEEIALIREIRFIGSSRQEPNRA